MGLKARPRLLISSSSPEAGICGERFACAAGTLTRRTPLCCPAGSQSESVSRVESFFGDNALARMLRAPDRARAPDLGRAAEPTSETLEQRVEGLSISIGTHAATAPSAQDRQMILETAREHVIEDLVERGHPLHEAALIADDIIEGAHRLASALAAHTSQPR